MSRTRVAIDHRTSERVLDAAVRCFSASGYHGTSIRRIAAEAHISVATVYETFACKQEILFEVIDTSYAALLRQTQAVVARAGEDPLAQLDAAVYAQCAYYTDNPQAAIVAQAELRSLDPERRALIEAHVLELGDIFTEILAGGVELGVFDVEEPAAVGRALASMCGAIPSWYDLASPEAPQQVARTYCDLGARMSGARRRPRPAARPGHLVSIAARRSA